MSGGTRKEREERATDALLVSALRQDDKEGNDIDPKCLPQLTEEEKAAMNALGNDFIERLLAGERPLQAKADQREDCNHNQGDLTLAGSAADCSFNRAEEVNDETTEELELREREVLERKGRGQKKAGDGSP